MWGRKKKKRRSTTCGNIWKEDVLVEDIAKEEVKEIQEDKPIRKQKVIEVCVNTRKGERKQYYDAMVQLTEEDGSGITYYIDDRVATIVVTEEKIDKTLAALEAVGLTDYGIYAKEFNPTL